MNSGATGTIDLAIDLNSIPTPTGPVVVGAVDWYFATTQGHEVAPIWRDLLRGLLTVPAEVRETFDAVAREADLSGVDGVGAAAQRLQQALDARLSLGMT